jgi:KDO2-lipid IV(A) lauroyltransferase
MSSARELKNDLIYGAIRFLMAIIEILPRDLGLKLAGMIGEMAAMIDVKERRLAESNLRRVYGDSWSDLRIRLAAKECFIMIARNAADVIRSRGWNENDLAAIVDVDGIEHFDRALKKGSGIIAITGHIGNFELLAAWFSAVKKVPVSVIGRKLYDSRLDKLVVENRERFGIENIPSDAPARKVLEALRKGRVLGVLMDLDSTRVSGVYVPFFGHLARTASGPIFIGRKTQSPVVPLAMFRTSQDRYRLRILPAFDIPATDNKDDDVMAAVAMCNQALEELISFDPTQWAWIHNRWRNKPSAQSGAQGAEEVGLSNG